MKLVPSASEPASPCSEETESGFLFCADCGSAHRMSPVDRAPLFALDGSATPTDDFQSFCVLHADHDLRILRRSNDAEIHSHPRWDPMRTVWWEASDGRTSFVVRSERPDVESPRRYGVEPGRLVLEEESAQLDDELLRGVLDDALFPHSAPPTHLDFVIDGCRRELAALPLDALAPVDEDRDDPNVQLACLPAPVVHRVRGLVAEVFRGAEAQRLAEVFERDLRFEIPVVRVVRRYAVRLE